MMMRFAKTGAATARASELQTGQAHNFKPTAKPGGDVLADLPDGVEYMNREQALRFAALHVERWELEFFKLVTVLSLIEAKSWWRPFPSFREYIEVRAGLRHHTVESWLKTFGRLYNCGIRSGTMFGIGWIKAKEIAKVVTHDNGAEWVGLAQQQSPRKLTSTVREYLAKEATKATDDPGSVIVTTKTFKVQRRQKAAIEAAIAFARDACGGGGSDALEIICLSYLDTCSRTRPAPASSTQSE